MAITTTTQGIQTGVCLSTARPSNPYLGQVIFETDTNLMKVWLGSAWSTGFAHNIAISGDVLMVGGGAGGKTWGGYGGAGGGGAAKVETFTYQFVKGLTWTVTIAGGGAGSTAGSASSLRYVPANNMSLYYLQTATGLVNNQTGAGGDSGNGYTGGSSGSNGGTGVGGGGGAGAGAVGTSVPSGIVGGNGGIGIVNNYQTGSNIYYGGGGGGGCGQQTAGPGGSGGTGGGGAGCNFNVGPGSAATANTGGGGGGATGGSAGGAGGSGIVVIRYLTADATGFTITGGTKTTVGLYQVHTFLSTGSFSVA